MMTWEWPIRAGPSKTTDGSSSGRSDSGYGTSTSTGHHRTFTISSRTGRSRDPAPPPSAYRGDSASKRSSSGRKHCVSRSESSRRSAAEQNFPDSSPGRGRSKREDDHFIYTQQGSNTQSRPPSSHRTDRYFRQDGPSSSHRSEAREPHVNHTFWDGKRDSRGNGEPSQPHSTTGPCPNCAYEGEQDQEVPHRPHFSDHETLAPRAPEQDPGLSKRERQFAEAMGNGIGTMMRALAHKQNTFNAVSVTVRPETMTWKMKTERVYSCCNEFIGRELHWRK